ncbi:MAG: S-methyl-5'-thioadenosine phosphorylase [Bacteroidales bacterium]|nr:S-methyl-5'-thioadenosine phosphorylase [Bacteroidales bacterium]
MLKIGIIGGSGLEKLNIFSETNEINIETKYGKPSSSLFCGKMGKKEIVILSRHGREHTITPTHVNNRANIVALKEIGCTHIFTTTACGSLREEIRRGDIVFLDQFIDFTKHRTNTFYDNFEPGILGHTAMADPFSEILRNYLIETAKEMGLAYHPRGTMVTIEGPRFSTRAESNMFRTLGADVINMSIAPEAALANEAKIPYAAIALCTDYDCWKIGEEAVSWEEVLEVFAKNVEKVTNLLVEVIRKI